MGEEIVVYPALREVPDGQEFADARVAEQSEAEEALARLEKLDATSNEFLGELVELRAAVLEHAQKEETEAFPRLLRHFDTAHLVYLGQKFKGAKLAAPNHPHPHLPSSPTSHKVIGPVAAFFDRMRDATRTSV